MQLQCTLDHKLKYNNNFVQVNKLQVGNILQNLTITNIQYVNNNTKIFYDITNVQNNNQYYTNGVISHNCIVLSTPNGTGNLFYQL